MTPVTLYTTPFCGYCTAAKRLLARKGVAYTEIDVTEDPAHRREMVQRAGGGRTVPQIFIRERHIGGYDAISALERAGQLDPLLAA
jgi:glutaredoxin 3